MTSISNAARPSMQDAGSSDVDHHRRPTDTDGSVPASPELPSLSLRHGAVLAIVALTLGAVFSVIGWPVPLGFNIAGWLFAAAIIAICRHSTREAP